MICVDSPNTHAQVPHDVHTPAESSTANNAFTEGIDCSGFDFLIVSDGSGCGRTRTGGCCVAVVGPDNSLQYTILAQNNTTVTRMEFQGLLEGLVLVRLHPDYYAGASVLWVCDNKGLVDSVNERNHAHANPDLWLLYDYHTSSLRITSKHVSRDNKILLHNLCDLHASTAREILLDYINSNVQFSHD